MSINSDRVNKALQGWRECNDVINTLSEAEAKAALAKEKKGKRRWKILERLHARLTRLRMRRERGELKKLANLDD